MDRYAQENASRLVQGYWLPRPWEDAANDFEPAFARAKAEATAALQASIQAIEALTFEKFRVSPGRR